MDIEQSEIIEEMTRKFPLEFQIVIQAIQIRHLERMVEPGTMDQ